MNWRPKINILYLMPFEIYQLRGIGMFKWFSTFLFVLSSSILFAHDFYVSTTNIWYQKDKNELQFEIHLIAHDLERALKNSGFPDLKLGSSNEVPDATEIIAEYCASKLKVLTNGALSKLKESKLKYQGKDLDADETLIVYFSVEAPMILRYIKLKNELLLDTFPAQENITYFYNSDQMKSYTFNYQLKETTFTIKE